MRWSEAMVMNPPFRKWKEHSRWSVILYIQRAGTFFWQSSLYRHICYCALVATFWSSLNWKWVCDRDGWSNYHSTRYCAGASCLGLNRSWKPKFNLCRNAAKRIQDIGPGMEKWFSKNLQKLFCTRLGLKDNNNYFYFFVLSFGPLWFNFIVFQFFFL